MKQIFYVLAFTVLLSGIMVSCKTNTLDTLRENELTALDKYVKNKKLADYKDVSGIYLKDSIPGTGDSIKSGYTVMLNYKITLLNGTVIFTTDDGSGHNYEEYAFHVDVSNATVNASYVQQISGLHKGLKKMRIGGRAFMVIPSELAFKAVDNSTTLGIPRFSTLLATVYAKRGYKP